MGRTTKYEDLLRDRGANFGEWLGAQVVDDFGDVAAEYAAACGEGADRFGIADLSSRGTVVALGSEVVPLLQGIVTSDVFALAEPGTGQHSTAVNSNGRLVCDLRLLHGPEILLMDFEPGLVEDGVVSHFRANIMSEDARFVDRTPATSIIGVYGFDGLAATADLDRDPAELETYCGTWGTIDGRGVVVRRSELGFELLLDIDDAPAVWELLEAAGGVPVGARALEILRVESGVPRWGAELDEKVIPLEAGLDHSISFNKGCYVGQEIIARLDTLGTPARRLRALELSGDAAVGDVVFDADKKVGELRTVIDSVLHGGPLGLAYLKRDHNDPGRAVQVGEQRTDAVVREFDQGRAAR